MKMKIKRKQMKCIGLLLVIMLSALSGYSQRAASEYKTVAENAAWCWFADPRAVYHKGTHERIYYGYINSKGDVVISSRDQKSKEEKTFILHKKLQIDDHNVPSILFLPDGRILTFYTEHNGRFFMRKSINPEDITSWEEERILFKDGADKLITYSHPVMLSEENNRIYMFFRGRNKKQKENPDFIDWKQYYSYSDDLGKTWTKSDYYISSKGVNVPPYMKIVSDNKSKIHFVFTDGHPKQSFCSIYTMYYEKGKFHQTNGDEIASITDVPLEFDKINKLYDVTTAKVRSWIWDIALDKRGNPVVTYTRYPSVKDHIYYYARWNGKQWIDKEMINSGTYITKPEKTGKVLEEHYSGGIVLDHNNPGNTYLARQVNGIFEIEHWRLKGDKWKTEAITSESKANNIRPYVVDRNKQRKPIVLWMNGNYEHYIRFDTDLLINEK